MFILVSGEIFTGWSLAKPCQDSKFLVWQQQQRVEVVGRLWLNCVAQNLLMNYLKKTQNNVFSIQFYKLDPSLSSDSIFGLSQSYMVVLTGP